MLESWQVHTDLNISVVCLAGLEHDFVVVFDSFHFLGVRRFSIDYYHNSKILQKLLVGVNSFFFFEVYYLLVHDCSYE